MCLEHISKKQAPDLKVRAAWKIFRCDLFPRSIAFQIFPYKRKFSVPRGKWLEERWDPLITRSDQNYQKGFHAYALKRDAEELATTNRGYIVLKVYLSGVHTAGYQWDCPAFVAKWLYVPKKNERPPRRPK